MRGVTVTLPPASAAKLEAISLARMAAEDAMRSAAARLNNNPDLDERMRAALTLERDKQSHRHSQLHQLLSKINEWLFRLRGVTLRPTPLIDIVLKNGETVSAQVERVRSEIAFTKSRLATVLQAQPPVGDLKQLAEEFVVQLIRDGRPAVSVQQGGLKVDARGDMFSARDVLSLIAWAAPDSLCRALERSIDALPVPSNVMSANEKTRLQAELTDQLAALELLEESLITRAHGEGAEILRRVDASPSAVLNVAVVREAQASAA